MIYYFAYGSNLDQAQMKERCPDSKFLGKAVLKNYKLGFTIYSHKRKCGCADIVKAGGSEIWGFIYILSEDDLKELDKCEGHPDNYKRIEVNVTDDLGKEINVFAYEVVNKKSFEKPSKEYLNIIKTTAKEYNFPEDYQEMLNSISTL